VHDKGQAVAYAVGNARDLVGKSRHERVGRLDGYGAGEPERHKGANGAADLVGRQAQLTDGGVAGRGDLAWIGPAVNVEIEAVVVVIVAGKAGTKVNCLDRLASHEQNC
jgi:hypothetical protein